MTAAGLSEHFFRYEYAKLVAILSRRVGVQHIEDVEDAVQTALAKALDHWPRTGLPDNPTAWLFRVAQRSLLGDLRKQNRQLQLMQRTINEDNGVHQDPELFLDEDLRDEQLRLLFICCEEEVPEDSRIAFTLKVLCGFSVREIAIRLFTSDANIYKRVGRARSALKKRGPQLDKLTRTTLESRLPTVHGVLYLLFTEGYLSSDQTLPIRIELCDEAIRLCRLLDHLPNGRSPVCSALLALMLLHAARLPARQNESGELLLLEEQDRELWDQCRIIEGISWLSQSAEGGLSRYHIEAAIAAEHCLAKSMEETRWDVIAQNYQLLEQFSTSPIHRLNRAIAVAEWKGPQSGLEILKTFEPPTWLHGSFQWAAVSADLNLRCGNLDLASKHRRLAIDLAPTPQLKALIRKRLNEP